MTTLETLKAARTLIASGEAWYPAPLSDGIGTKIGANGNVQRCMGAAICDAGAPWPSRQDVWDAMDEQIGGNGDFAKWNLDHNHAEVLAAFDAAIAKLEKGDAN
jgi:hypothetical protein